MPYSHRYFTTIIQFMAVCHKGLFQYWSFSFYVYLTVLDTSELISFLLYFQVISKCGCISGHIFHSAEQLQSNPYCGSMEVSPAVLLERINCSVTTVTDFDSTRDCECPFPCETTYYPYTTSQSSWPHISYHLPLYTKYINFTSFADKFQGTYEPAAQLEFTADAPQIIPMLRSTDLITRNFLQVHITMSSGLLVHYEDRAATSWEHIVGSMGGILNLWCGITFITLIELVELGYKLLWPHAEEKKSKVTVVEPCNPSKTC